MKKELKKKWIDALRSGKYEQGQYCLRNIKDKYCCLGVLADNINNVSWKIHPADKMYELFSENERNQSYIPNEYLNMDIQKFLSEMNDNSALSFEEIANWIEENIMEEE